MSLLLLGLEDITNVGPTNPGTGLAYAYPLTVTFDVAAIVAGDAYPFLSGTVRDALGQTVDLSEPLEVRFVAAKANDGRVVTAGLCDLPDPVDGRFTYKPAPGDFDQAAPACNVQLHLVYAAGLQAVPSDRYATLAVLAPLDPGF